VSFFANANCRGACGVSYEREFQSLSEVNFYKTNENPPPEGISFLNPEFKIIACRYVLSPQLL
jgi:hypothetical protein